MLPRFERRNFETRLLETAGSPLLFARLPNPDAGVTVLVYLQADGQPVDRSRWFQDDPYTPVLKERGADGDWNIIPWHSLDEKIDPDWRIFARSASDSKGPMTQFLIAMDILEQAGVAPAFDLKVIVDTEEELGSPNLPDALARHRDLLAADMLVGLVRAHIEKLGFHVVDEEPTEAERQRHADIVRFESEISYAAFRSGFDDPPGLLARAGMKNLYGEEPILIRTMGGSIPIAPFVETLGAPAAIVPTVNMDNNQHSPNENLRLGNFIEGIAVLASVLSRKID
jgi:acetylornithine deacetylase/succinyl-diaminopimelate desuccinylase-like protein